MSPRLGSRDVRRPGWSTAQWSPLTIASLPPRLLGCHQETRSCDRKRSSFVSNFGDPKYKTETYGGTWTSSLLQGHLQTLTWNVLPSRSKQGTQ